MEIHNRKPESNSLFNRYTLCKVTWFVNVVAPVADAGPDQLATLLGSTVQLDSTKSWDNDGDTIYYSWTMISKPATSAAALSDPALSNPTFVADVQGDYVMELVVDDGWATSSQVVQVPLPSLSSLCQKIFIFVGYPSKF